MARFYTQPTLFQATKNLKPENISQFLIKNPSLFPPCLEHWNNQVHTRRNDHISYPGPRSMTWISLRAPDVIPVWNKNCVLSPSGGTSLTYIIPQPALVPRPRAEASLRYAEMTTKVQRRNWDKNIYFEINMWCADVLLVADRSSYLSHKMDFSGRPHIWWLMGGESSHLLFVLVNTQTIATMPVTLLPINTTKIAIILIIVWQKNNNTEKLERLSRTDSQLFSLDHKF